VSSSQCSTFGSFNPGWRDRRTPAHESADSRCSIIGHEHVFAAMNRSFRQTSQAGLRYHPMPCAAIVDRAIRSCPGWL